MIRQPCHHDDWGIEEDVWGREYQACYDCGATRETGVNHGPVDGPVDHPGRQIALDLYDNEYGY